MRRRLECRIKREKNFFSLSSSSFCVNYNYDLLFMLLLFVLNFLAMYKYQKVVGSKFHHRVKTRRDNDKDAKNNTCMFVRYVTLLLRLFPFRLSLIFRDKVVEETYHSVPVNGDVFSTFHTKGIHNSWRML